MYLITLILTILVFAAIVLIWGITVYNKLINKQNMQEEAWSGIDVQLKRRHDLIGNLINTVKGYMQHEKEILEEIARLRSASQGAGNVAAVSSAESGLNQALGRLFAVAENYPNLRANDSFLQLQDSLSSLEGEIQMARRYYNATVREMNILIQSFPSSIIAKRYEFKKAEFFELTNMAEREVPSVQF